MANIITICMEEARRGKETGVDNWLYRIEILYRMDKNKRKKFNK